MTCVGGLRQTERQLCDYLDLSKRYFVILLPVPASLSHYARWVPESGHGASRKNTGSCIEYSMNESIFFKPATTIESGG